MPELNYHHLRYFRAVAHEGNLTRAAEKLFVSQSAVSVQIRKLEQALGHDLFDRVGRDLVLTEAGRIALDHADEIFSVGRQLVDILNERGQERVVLRIGSQATLSRNFQLRFLAPLFSRSDVEIVARSGTFAELIAQLEAHQLDVVLANWAPPRDHATRWVAHTIAYQGLSLIGGPEGEGGATRVQVSAGDAGEASRPDRPPGDPGAWDSRPGEKEGETDGEASGELGDLLQGAPLILPARESSVRVGFDALVDRMDLRITVAAEVDDMAMLRLLTRQGVGRAVIPPIVVRDELASGELVELARLPGLRETFYAITPSRRFPNPLLRELLEAAPLGEEEG
jgi:LysR family transcriptional regulator, transcriptional activator of nhaA